MGAGFEGLDDGGGEADGGGFDVGGGVVVVGSLLSWFVFCGLVSPLSAVAVASAALPWEQQFPMVEGREEKKPRRENEEGKRMRGRGREREI